MLGYSLKAAYLRTEGRNHVGVEGGFTLRRGKANVGLWWALDDGADRFRLTWDLGFGF